MKKRYLRTRFIIVMACLGVFSSVSGSAEIALTGITVFACDAHGTVNPALRFNSGPIDPAWDLFVAPTGIEPAASPTWLNREDNRVRIPLEPGTHSFVLHFDSPGLERFMGVNLFFGGEEALPRISAYVDTQAADPSQLRPNSADKTHGLPIADIPGAGTLEFTSGAAGFWTAGVSAHRTFEAPSRNSQSRSRGRGPRPRRSERCLTQRATRLRRPHHTRCNGGAANAHDHHSMAAQQSGNEHLSVAGIRAPRPACSAD